MPNIDKIRVVVDTNLWISSLIGRQLSSLREMLSYPRFELILTPQLYDEIIGVAQRPKLQKYFDADKIKQLSIWLQENTIDIPIHSVPPRCRDPKDDYLLELAVQSKAIYLVSGDNDLLEYGQIEGCRIMTVKQFEAEVYKQLLVE